MTLLTALTSLLAGSFFGLLYGLSFGLFRNRRALLPLATTARLVFFSIVIIYLLRFPTIHFIIVLPSFLIMFWLSVLKRKAVTDEQRF